jgi:DNA-binding MarR family transcriptional regulator
MLRDFEIQRLWKEEIMDCDINRVPTIGLMSRIMHMSMDKVRILFEQYDLKPGQAGILFMLDHKGQMSQREMAALMNVTPPSITTAIQKMEKMGFIKRRLDDKDQRIMRLSLTEKGRECVKYTKEVAMKMDEILFRDMSQEEIMLFRRLLLQVEENLKVAGGSPT